MENNGMINVTEDVKIVQRFVQPGDPPSIRRYSFVTYPLVRIIFTMPPVSLN